jgi:predicted metal-dependent enzyme (double-stranded beta helix superfamily)
MKRSEGAVAAAQGTTIRSLLPARDRTLTPSECESLARAIGTSDEWRAIGLHPTESGTRAYALLYDDAHVEVWLLAWLPGHTTGWHDHGVSNLGLCMVAGAIAEQQLRFAAPPTERLIATGETRSAGSDYIHLLEWREGAPAVSVHVYSPPLDAVGQYRIGPDGIVTRDLQSGRDELTLD